MLLAKDTKKTPGGKWSEEVESKDIKE